MEPDDLDVLDANSDIRRFEPTPLLEISTEENREMLPLGSGSGKTPTSRQGGLRPFVQQLLKTLLVKRLRARRNRLVTALRILCMRNLRSGDDPILHALPRRSKVTSLLTVSCRTRRGPCESFLVAASPPAQTPDETGSSGLSPSRSTRHLHDDSVYSFDITNAAS